MAVARSKTLLCKLTLRVCIAGSERGNGGESGQEGRGEKDREKEEIKRQRAVRDIKKRGQCEKDDGDNEQRGQE